MKIIVMSDLHLGSPRSVCGRFRDFLRNLPPDTVLVMNGDSVDSGRRTISAEHRETLAAICEESFRRRIVWTWGNHDRAFLPAEPNKIESVASWSNGPTYFAHGDKFMPLAGAYSIFNRLMRIYRACRMPDSLTSIRLARRLPLLFAVLTKGSIAKAVRFAEVNGYETVVCGHLHTVLDTTVRGVRYINTGAWTEWPAFHLSCVDGDMRLVKGAE